MPFIRGPNQYLENGFLYPNMCRCWYNNSARLIIYHSFRIRMFVLANQQLEQRRMEIPKESDPCWPLWKWSTFPMQSDPLVLKSKPWIECRLERFLIPTACIWKKIGCVNYMRKRWVNLHRILHNSAGKRCFLQGFPFFCWKRAAAVLDYDYFLLVEPPWASAKKVASSF